MCKNKYRRCYLTYYLQRFCLYKNEAQESRSEIYAESTCQSSLMNKLKRKKIIRMLLHQRICNGNRSKRKGERISKYFFGYDKHEKSYIWCKLINCNFHFNHGDSHFRLAFVIRFNVTWGFTVYPKHAIARNL